MAVGLKGNLWTLNKVWKSFVYANPVQPVPLTSPPFLVFLLYYPPLQSAIWHHSERALCFESVLMHASVVSVVIKYAIIVKLQTLMMIHFSRGKTSGIPKASWAFWKYRSFPLDSAQYFTACFQKRIFEWNINLLSSSIK